jgi:hypothetical protein
MTDGPSPLKTRRPRRLASIPEGCWPARMRVELAAGMSGKRPLPLLYVACATVNIRLRQSIAGIGNFGSRTIWIGR